MRDERPGWWDEYIARNHLLRAILGRVPIAGPPIQDYLDAKARGVHEAQVISLLEGISAKVSLNSDANVNPVVSGSDSDLHGQCVGISNKSPSR